MLTTIFIGFVVGLVICALITRLILDVPQQRSYEESLTSDKWKNKRLQILNRDNYQCQYCKSTKNLQVHHKYYSKYPNGKMVEPWNYPDDALITLCQNCHTRVHNNKAIKVYYRKYYDNY